MFEAKQTAQRLSLRMSASLENIDRSDEACSAFLTETQAPIDHFAIRILLRESVLNAVTHGSGEDESKTVLMTCELDSRGVILTVEDEGPGFFWKNHDGIPDILGDGGRGMPLMEIYATEMSYNERGNRIVLRRNYDSPVAHKV